MESAPAAGGFGGFGQAAAASVAGEPQRTDYDQAARELFKVCVCARVCRTFHLPLTSSYNTDTPSLRTAASPLCERRRYRRVRRRGSIQQPGRDLVGPEDEREGLHRQPHRGQVRGCAAESRCVCTLSSPTRFVMQS